MTEISNILNDIDYFDYKQIIKPINNAAWLCLSCSNINYIVDECCRTCYEEELEDKAKYIIRMNKSTTIYLTLSYIRQQSQILSIGYIPLDIMNICCNYCQFCPPFHRKEFISLEMNMLIGSVVFNDLSHIVVHKGLSKYFTMIQYTKDNNNTLNPEQYKFELKVLSTLHHPFILNLFASFQDDWYLYLILEQTSNDTLYNIMVKSGNMKYENCTFYGAQIVLILLYLHENHIIYGNLYPEHLMVDKNGYLKLSDFRFSKRFNNDDTNNDDEEISFIVDWWALGLLIYRMLSGRKPRQFVYGNGNGLISDLQEWRNHIDFPMDDNKQHIISEKGREIILKLLTKDITEQINVTDIMSHSFFDNINWTKLLQKEIVNVPWKPNGMENLEESNGILCANPMNMKMQIYDHPFKIEYEYVYE